MKGKQQQKQQLITKNKQGKPDYNMVKVQIMPLKILGLTWLDSIIRNYT